MTQDVGSDPTVGAFSDAADDVDDDVDDSELFYCTYCGKDLELEEGYVRLMVGEKEVEVKKEKEMEGGSVNVFDLSEMSRMEEEEDEEMDEELDDDLMDVTYKGDGTSCGVEGGAEGSSHLESPERKTS